MQVSIQLQPLAVSIQSNNYQASYTNSPLDSSTWQSDGLCHDFCSDGFAFSVVKGDDCWCSDYVPDESTQVDTSECNTQCPGYPDDTCGGNGLWGYMAQAKDPAGTKGSSGTTQTSTPVSAPVFVVTFSS